MIGLIAAYVYFKNKQPPSVDEQRRTQIKALLNAEPDPYPNRAYRHQQIYDPIDWYNLRRVAGQYELERTWNEPSIRALGMDRWQLSRYYPSFQSLYYKSPYGYSTVPRPP